MTTATVKIGVDGFPIDPTNIYYEQHLAIDPILQEVLNARVWYTPIIHYLPTQLLVKQESKFQVKAIFAIFERLNWLDKVIWSKSSDEIYFIKLMTTLIDLFDKLVSKDLGYEETDLTGIIRWCVVDYLQQSQHIIDYNLKLPVSKILSRIEKYGQSHSLSEELKAFVSESYSFGGVTDKVGKILSNQSTRSLGRYNTRMDQSIDRNRKRRLE
jgi:hypothetical protein